MPQVKVECRENLLYLHFELMPKLKMQVIEMVKLTDQEIVERLIERDNRITKWFFYTKCQPLFNKIIFRVFGGNVEYAELVAMVYDNLMRDDAKKLRQFEFRSTLTKFIKVVALHISLQKKDEVIENVSKDYLYEQKGGNYSDVFANSDGSYVRPNSDTTSQESMGEVFDATAKMQARMDLETLFSKMKNQRYVLVLKKLMLEDVEPAALAKEMNITVDNLYNIKRRAMKELTHVALRDIDKYVNIHNK